MMSNKDNSGESKYNGKWIPIFIGVHRIEREITNYIPNTNTSMINKDYNIKDKK